MTVLPEAPVEFSRPKPLDRLPRAGFEAEIAASETECAALAERLGIGAVHALAGRLEVTRPGGGPELRVAGTLRAEVTQTCVVTLEPVRQSVSERFVQRFTLAPADDVGGAAGEEVFADPEAEEAPEPLSGPALDLGEVLAEQLALALDPYPRQPGAVFQPPDATDAVEADAAPAVQSPFAGLDALLGRN